MCSSRCNRFQIETDRDLLGKSAARSIGYRSAESQERQIESSLDDKNRTFISSYRSIDDPIYEIEGNVFSAEEFGILMGELHKCAPPDPELMVILEGLAALANLYDLLVRTRMAWFTQDQISVI